jgi:hypothetical protein
MAKMYFSSPATEDQKNYFARSAPLRFWAGFLVIITPLAWGAMDFYGLSGLIMPQNPVLSAVVTVLLLIFAHGILAASAMMAGYDFFDNYRVESPALFMLPAVLAVGLLYFSWIGAEQIYLNNYAHKAVVVKTDDLDSRKTNYDLATKTKFDGQKAAVKEAKALARKAVNASFARSLAAASKIAVHDAADKRFRANSIAAVQQNITAKLGEIDAAEAAELSAIGQNANAESQTYAVAHSTEVKAIGDGNTAERVHEALDKEGASGKSFWFAVGLAALFFVSVAARTRTDCKSGIIPKYDHTDGDKSDKVRETVFVLNAIIGSNFSRLLSATHERFAVEYETITPKNKKPLISAIAPPTGPPPPTIAPNGGSIPPPSGGNGGGNPPASPQSPPPAPADALQIVSSQRFATLSLQDRDTMYNLPVGGVSQTHWTVALNEVNPMICFFSNGLFMADPEDAKKVQNLANSYTQSVNKFVAVKELIPFQELGTNQHTIAKLTFENGKVPYDFKIWFDALNDCNSMIQYHHPGWSMTDAEFSRTLDLARAYAKPTLRYATPSQMIIAPVAQAETETTVAQPIRTVPQLFAEIIYTELDDKLNLLKSKLQKEARSNFNNSQANNNTIRLRICNLLDEGTMALFTKNAKCTPSVLAEFYKVAQEKLALMAEFKTESYGAEEDFHRTIQNRLGEEVRHD